MVLLSLGWCDNQNWSKPFNLVTNWNLSYILIHVAKLWGVLDNMPVKLNDDRKRKTIIVYTINKPPTIPLFSQTWLWVLSVLKKPAAQSN